MIKLLLIQPENREINRFRRAQFNNFSQITMPYLAAFVDERHFEMTLVDEYHQKIPYNRAFDLVAITVNTPNAPHCYEISAKFRARGAKVVMGGPHATLLPLEVQPHCDYLLAGESEATWKPFLDDFLAGMPDTRYQSDVPPPLDGLPAPRWDLLKRNRLMKGAVFATRGCPYNCRYCNLKQIYHDCFRSRPVSEVIAEIRAIKSRFFVFWDDNLFADREYAKALLRGLAPLKRKWAAQATIRDCADEELLSLAKAAGCMYLFVGLEAFSDRSLNDAGKTVNRVDDYAPIVGAIHRHGIMVQAGIVFGFDSDGRDVFERTLAACEKLGIDGATASILTPFPGTPIYEQFKAEGRLLSEDWSRFNSKTAVAFAPKNMAAEELFAGYLSFRRRFYSIGSFVRRMSVSRTNVAVNFVINLGYRLGLKSV
ncbi:B12-binding domain-containing radical SAM protein [Clostridia bacterium]|nr:B12-binding domain-containing radical SAM protein [Clostridia bacterium]